jgi:hypothetical protein
MVFSMQTLLDSFAAKKMQAAEDFDLLFCARATRLPAL